MANDKESLADNSQDNSDSPNSSVRFIDPRSGAELSKRETGLFNGSRCAYPFRNGAYRLVEGDNYTASFGLQWNAFDRTQLDSHASVDVSRERLSRETAWTSEILQDSTVLEVGSGAGRFTEVLLELGAKVYSVDYSDAVTANARNNRAEDNEKLDLFQASIYEMPFATRSFDFVLCLGVLQHTPDFEASLKSLYDMVAPAGELVVDFYPVKGWWTKLNGKYLVRPITRRLPPELLFSVVKRLAPPFSRLTDTLADRRLGLLNRFIPVVPRQGVPNNLTDEQRREWTILDTFDMLSPAHDHPQPVGKVVSWLESFGAEVTFAGDVAYGYGLSATVVRAVRPPKIRHDSRD